MERAAEIDSLNLPTQLGARLAHPLPPEEVRGKFAPWLSYGRHFGPPDHDAREAAVLVLIYERHGRWHIPLTVRPDTMLSHAGQISLPGGMVEPGEAMRDAAVRELEEELGIPRKDVEVLGSLSPLYVFASNFLVMPWVAVARAPIEFHPCAKEVAAVLEVPLAHLIDPANHGTHQQQRGNLAFTAPHIAFEGHHVWGATAIVLGELLAVLADISAD